MEFNCNLDHLAGLPLMLVHKKKVEQHMPYWNLMCVYEDNILLVNISKTCYIDMIAN